MGLFRKLLQHNMKSQKRICLLKTLYSEKKAIRHKKPLYKDICWTAEQKGSYEQFWRENYGKVFPSDWHRLYQSANGCFDVAYFPEILFTTRLEPMLNPKSYCDVFSDKNLLEVLFDGDADLAIPKTYLACANGTCFNAERSVISAQELKDSFTDIGECILKPTVETGSGRDVQLVCMQGGIDRRSGKTAAELLKRAGGDFCVQEKIDPCEQLQRLSPSCVSTVRLITYIANNRVFHAPLVLRVGTGRADVDNIHAGGLCVGINDDGTLKPKAYRLGYGDRNEVFYEHPNSRLVFGGYRLPAIETMIRIACKLHERIPQLGIVSWDFTINHEEKVVLIEANCADQSVWFPQIVNGEALFGDNTPYFLKMLAKER